MSGGIEGLGFTTQTPQHVGDAQHAQQATGQYHGQNVVQGAQSQQSLVESSLEELPANLAETMSKRLAQRTAKNRSTSRIQEVMEKYLKAVSGVNQTEKFQQLAESMKKLNNPTPDQIKQLIQDQFQDYENDNIKDYEAALFLALEEFFVAEGDNDQLLEAVREVKAQLGTELQDFYKQQVQTYEGVTEVYDQLLGQGGEQDFLAATETLITRLGNDLQGKGRTMDQNQVKATLDSLYHLEVARNTYVAFAELADKMHSLFGAGGSAN